MRGLVIKSAATLTLLSVLSAVPACRTVEPAKTITVSLRNTDIYQYPTVSGDEESARITSQPRHYTVSEIRRDAGTNWVATYVYQPAAGFLGSDYAEIEILTGSDGASAPTNIQRIAFVFTVHD